MGFLLPNFQWGEFFQKKSFQVKIGHTMNLNSKVSHLFLSLPEISTQGGEKFFLAEKGIVGEKVYFLAKKLLYLQKKVNFFPCSKKVIFGLQQGFFVPQFSGGITFCHYA